ncbi:MAG: PEGA domain-containing protein [Deltaproteobacteria bacterium]|nr:MAG: PEGA domain-containing protein [Deltaproteobacteria bacterium]
MRFTSNGSDRRYAGGILLILFLFSFSLTSIAVPLPAEERKEVIFFRYSDESVEDAESLYGMMEKHLEEVLGALLVKPGEFHIVREGPEFLPQLPATLLVSWRERLEKAREKFRLLDLEGAFHEVEEILGAPYRYSLPPESRDVYAEAAFLGAFLLSRLGRSDEAERVLLRSSSIVSQPGPVLDLYPPDFSRFVRNVFKKDRSCRLVVNSDPAGAKVTVDGEELGTTPLTAKLEKTGLVRVKVEKEGYVGREVRTVVLPGDERVLSVTLPLSEVNLISGAVARGDLRETVRISRLFLKRTGREALLISVLKRGGEKPLFDLLFVTSGKRKEYYSHFRNLSGSDRVIMKKDLLPFFSDSLVREVFPGTLAWEAEFREKEEKTLLTRWWFWGLVAVGAAGVVYGLTQGKRGDSGGSVTVQF